MCGRFACFIDIKTLIEAFGLDQLPDPQFDLPSRFNIAPSQEILAICQNGDGYRHPKAFRWGLIPHWAKEPSIGNRLINARSETIHQKPSFRSALRYRRCLIPANGFFEWVREGKTKQPYFIHRKDDAPLAFAGLWESWKAPQETIHSCTILTTKANALVAPIHDRMPVILSPAEYGVWLDREVDDPEKLTGFYRPFPADLLAVYPVSSAVNSPKTQGEECILALQSQRRG